MRCRPVPEDDRVELLARSLSYFQENIRRSGPAASAGYALIGAILLCGGVGYALDVVARHVSLVSDFRSAPGHHRRVLRVGEGRLARVTARGLR